MRTFALATLFFAAPVLAQDAPVKIQHLRTDKGQAPLPPIVHLKLELTNPANEPRWILLSLGRESRLPKDGRFNVDPDSGLPVFVLQSKNDSGRAAMVGFLGEPRFMAFLLPAQSTATFADFELPSVNDLSELDWIEAKSLTAGKTPLEKWLPVDLSCSNVKFGKDQSWTDALRDDKGEPRGDLPKDKISEIAADVSRSGRIAVEGFTAPARYYQGIAANDAANEELPPGWSLLAAFRPVRPLKVEHLAFSPDGTWAAASLQTYKVVGLELGKNRERVFPMSERSLARFFAFSPEGNLLVKQAVEPLEEDANLDLADWSAGKVLDVLRFSSRVTLGNIDHIPTADGLKVAIAQRTSLNIWDFVKLEGTARLKWPEWRAPFKFKAGLFSPDGKRFAAGFENPVEGGKAVVWDVESQKILREYSNKQGPLTMLSFSADGKVLAATGPQASTVCVWLLDDPDQTAQESGFSFIRDFRFSNISAMAISPDGKTVALAASPLGKTEARPIDLFDVDKKARIGSLPGLRIPVTALAFSRDSRRIAGGDQLGAVRVWERK